MSTVWDFQLLYSAETEEDYCFGQMDSTERSTCAVCIQKIPGDQHLQGYGEMKTKRELEWI